MYALVGQPAIIWWMLENTQLYELAWLNGWIFLIALIISLICKPKKSEKKDNDVKLVQRSEEKVSRIESDAWVAIVEVEKKEEVVVESKAEENQEDSNEEREPVEEKFEEKLEDKTEETEEEKKVERPMKETVTIPKIVQPITWGYTSTKRRKREKKWGQWLILLLTLWIALIIAWTLREFLGNWWIAIALFLWWILYLVIGKLFDVNWFYNAKKLFSNWLYIVLILAWIWYWAYSMQYDSIELKWAVEWRSDKVITYVKDLFKWEEDEVLPEIDTWAIYIFEWTWEVISNTGSNDEISDNTWNVENIEENIEDSINIENTQEDTPVLISEEAKKQVTMWDAIKHLLLWTTLSDKTSATFKYVAKTSELYPYFKTAQEKWMIGSDTDPSKYVSCETYITMKWLAEWWYVWSYVKSEIKSVYWNKATDLWKLNWCTKWSYVTKGTL